IAGTGGVAIAGPANAAASLNLDPGDDGNTYTGGTYLNGANLGILQPTSLGDPSSPLELVGGTISGSAPTLANPVNLTNAVPTLNAGSLAFAGTVTLTGRNVLTVSSSTSITGKITGSGSLVELGTTSLILNPSTPNDYSGGTVLAAGSEFLILS